MVCAAANCLIVNTKHASLLLEGIAIIALFALRIFRLEQTGLFDYDSVRNYLTIQEILQGDFQHLFHHASPSFHLIFAPILATFKHFLALEYANSAIGVWAAVLLARFFSKTWRLPYWQHFLLLLIMGSSTFLVVSSRYFSIENLSFLFFVWILIAYNNHLRTNKAKYWRLLWLLLAISFTVNYKTLLLFPIILLIELIQSNRKLKFSDVAFIPVPFIGLGLGYSLLGALLKIGVLNYAKYVYVVAFVRDTNPAIDKSKFDWELLYYPKYFINFENLLAIVGLIFLVWSGKNWLNQIFKQLRQHFKLTFDANLLFFVFFSCLFIGLSLVEKAPRAIQLCYPFIYGFALLGIFRVLKKTIIIVAVGLLFFYLNFWNISQYIYPYSDSNYPKVAQYLQQQKINQVTLTVGLGLVPFLDETISWNNVFSETELESKSSPNYLLIDGHHQIVGLGNFSEYATKKTILSMKEPSLLSPYLYLEHCEYTDQSYDEAIRAWQKAINQDTQLTLISW